MSGRDEQPGGSNEQKRKRDKASVKKDSGRSSHAAIHVSARFHTLKAIVQE
jgi:hypothetical protein